MNLGLTNLGYLEFMKKMGQLLITKKKLDKRLRKITAVQVEKTGQEKPEPTKEMTTVKDQIKKI